MRAWFNWPTTGWFFAGSHFHTSGRKVCPEHIKITDNGIIPLKERVVDRYYDPVTMLWGKLAGWWTKKKSPVAAK